MYHCTAVLHRLQICPSAQFILTQKSIPVKEICLRGNQLSSPLGIIGNTLMDNASFQNDLFRVKHSFFVHTLADEILLSLLEAIRGEKKVRCAVKSTRSENVRTIEGVPLKIWISTRTGRRFLCLYLPEKKRFTCARLDAVKEVKVLEIYSGYPEIREKLDHNQNLVWGVSFQNQDHRHLEHVRLTLHIHETSEAYILNRPEREGKGGMVKRIAPDTFTYEADVFDANEMLPWIRSFTGRILSIESDCPKLKSIFERDLSAMYQMYFDT